MPLIKLNKEGIVRLTLNISGLVDWSFEYYDEEKKYKCSNKESIDGTTCNHELGLPSQLDHHTNNWGIMIVNRSFKEQEFSVDLIWNQNGINIHKWSPKNNGKLLIKSSDVKSYGDNAMLIIE